jgi:hypothetical protein
MPKSVQGLTELDLENLHEPAFYPILFGDNPPVDPESLPDKIPLVRLISPAARVYEIITGVEQFRGARRRGARTLVVYVREMGDDEARRYATDEFLRNAAYASNRSVVQLLVVAKDNESRGGDWGVGRLTTLLGVKKSTYTHAWSSVSFVCEQLRRSDPEVAQLGLAELVALAVSKNFIPEFTALYAGRITVNKFYREVYQASALGKERSRQQREAKGRNEQRSEVVNSRRAAADAETDNLTPVHGAARPSQLVAEAVVKLAQAASAGDDGDSSSDLNQQIIAILNSHANLEAPIRLICRQLLNHFDSTRTRRRRSKPRRNTQPVRLDNARQLSFDLPPDSAAGHESDGQRDDEAHAA